jgi:hypothetical protein
MTKNKAHNAGAQPESVSERLAKVTLERILGTSLHRVTEDASPSPDYRFTTPDGLAAVEVKELASPDWLILQDGFSKYDTERATGDLSMHWQVSLPAEVAAERLTPPPDFPEDDDAQIARFAMLGLTVQRKAERIAEFERRRQETPKPIRVKGMIDDLIPDLQVLETQGITSTRGPMPSDPAGERAWWRIAGRTRNAICLASPANPTAGLHGGVFLSMSHGFVRTSRADTIAERIQTWFDTETKSANLVASLDRSEYNQGHAVLVFDGLEPESWSAQDADTFLPTRPMDLPEPVDVVWVLLGSCTLRYSADDGWQEYRPAPPAQEAPLS